MSLAPTSPSSMFPQTSWSLYNAKAHVASESGLLLLRDAGGVLTPFRTGAREITLYGFEPDQLPAVGDVVSIWGSSLELGHFRLSRARCISHDGGPLRNSATFEELLPGSLFAGNTRCT